MTGNVINTCEFYENGYMATQQGVNENGFDFVKEWDENGVLRTHYEENEDSWFYKEWDANGNLVTNESGDM